MNDMIDWSTIHQAYVYGFSYRKFLILKKFIPNTKLKRVAKLSEIPVQSVIVVWGMAPLTGFEEKHCTLVRVEDGFLRSIGLGAALTQPVSWVFDDCGMYFNTQQVSRLEKVLNGSLWSRELLTRAAQIQTDLIQNKLSKYNLLNVQVDFPDISDRKKILVIGQVEGDASLEYGSPAIKKNIELLETVYKANSQDYILYRPHPDVVSGWRTDSLAYDRANLLCNKISAEGNILDWIEWADEIHVMTSLTGFEALIRGKKVYCYGLPFYSGWGLTQDYLASPREKRTLTLLELIAGTLIVYPRYRSISKKNTCGQMQVEDAIKELSTMQPKDESFLIRCLKPFLRRD
ncbi:hypothetical protein [Acinetobacter sp.]|uniref:capsular polysaccharide export protein, LipB/KpsS family n=1 Tax=Acinetobacter sp. TaxID=472 RepID=UPI0031D856F9